MAYNESPEERERRNVLIVRENALGHAVEVIKILSKDADSTAFNPKGLISDITGVAAEFEDWVMRGENKKLETTGPTTTPVIKPVRSDEKACPKCGEMIPANYKRHFKCGWAEPGEQK